MEKLSKKLQSHIENPKFLLAQDKLSSAHGDYFQIGKKRYSLSISTKLSSYGNIECLGFSTDYENSFYIGLFDSILEMINDRPFYAISEINEREVESFLRDRNDVFSYDRSLMSENFRENDILRIFQKCIALNIGKEISYIVNGLKTDKKFDEYHLFEKINFLENVRESALNPLFMQFQIEIQFEELWHENLYYRLNLPGHRESETLRAFIKKILVNSFVTSDNLSKLNWVAEL